jgi:hypothetical protein
MNNNEKIQIFQNQDIGKNQNNETGLNIDSEGEPEPEYTPVDEKPDYDSMLEQLGFIGFGDVIHTKPLIG